jgi:phosphopentomutase
MKIRRVIMVVLDSAGVGEMPDAASYGDSGANTLGNLALRVGSLDLPNLAAMGLGRVLSLPGVSPEAFRSPGGWGKCAVASPGKDTITGHWEMMGIILERPFPTYPQGFPLEVMETFARIAGKPALGNKAASGTEIIQELGDSHVLTGRPIVYTSADSVFQVASHESVLPPEALWGLCRAMRDALTGPHAVGRVIARPFTGTSGNYRRTVRRKDFPAVPPHETVLDRLVDSGVAVTGIGKIGDLFAMRGISRSVPTRSNLEGIRALEDFAQNGLGFCFANLIDFDMLYGHRNDVEGYWGALREFDQGLERLLKALRPGDYLAVTADHGCDPTFPGTDHTREHVPILARGGKREADLGTRATLADLGAFACQALGVPWEGPGQGFLGDLEGEGDT